MLTIRIRNDEGELPSVPFETDVVTLGRAEDADIRLTERNVSREHARVVKRDGGIYLEDSGARFGTYINGERLAPKEAVAIGPGDLIGVGDFILELHADRPAASSSEPAEESLLELGESSIIEIDSDSDFDIEFEPGSNPDEIAVPDAPLERASVVEPSPPQKPAPEKPTPAPISVIDELPQSGGRASTVVMLIVVLLACVALVYIYFTFFHPDAAVDRRARTGERVEAPALAPSGNGAPPGKLAVEEASPPLVTAAPTTPPVAPAPSSETPPTTTDVIAQTATATASATPIAEKTPAPQPEPLPIAEKTPAPQPEPLPIAEKTPTPQPEPLPIAEKTPAPAPKPTRVSPPPKRSRPATRRTQDPTLLYQEAIQSESLARRRALLEQAIRVRPNFAQAHIKLATTLRTLGNRDGAIRHYREYLVLKPNAFDKDTVRAEIQKLGGRP